MTSRIDMKHSTVLWLVAACLLWVSGSVSAVQPDERDTEVREFDRVVMKTGEELTGEIYDDTPIQFWLRMKDGAQKFLTEDVQRIDRRNPPEAAYRARKRLLDDTDPDAQRTLAEFCVQYELRPESIKHYEALAKLSPADPDVYLALLAIYQQTPDIQKTGERRDQEIAVCSRGIRAGVLNPDLHYRVARLVELTGDQDMAIYLLRRVLELPEAAIENHRKRIKKDLVRLLVATGDPEAAERELDSDGGAEGQSEIELLVLKAKWLLEDVAAGDDNAKAKFNETIEQAIALDRDNAGARLLRACYLLLEEDFEAAQKSFTEAMSRGASGPSLALSYALNFARSGDSRLATELLATVRNAPGADELSKLIQAYIHENLAEDEAAWELIQEAVGEEGASWQTWLIYLQALTRFQPDTDIRPAAEHFLSMFGHNEIAFSECAILLGDAALRRGDGAEARRWLAYAAETDSGDFELLLRLGCAHLAEGGDLVRARRALEQAHELDAIHQDVRNALGCLEYRSGNLEIARRWFTGVIGEYEEKMLDESKPPKTLAYALRGIQLVEGVLDEELWVDSFDREGSSILNNWVEQETFGVTMSLQGGAATFDGTQAYEADGLTVLHRALDPEELSRFRCRIRLSRGADKTRVALRFENMDGTEGIVFFRDLDGVMAFAENSKREFEAHRPKEEASPDGATPKDSDEADDPFDMQRAVWKADAKWHVLEVRLDPKQPGKAELYFDGVRVARNVKIPGRGRAGLRCGVSGQAALGVPYRFEVDDFEVFRRRAKSGSSRQR